MYSPGPGLCPLSLVLGPAGPDLGPGLGHELDNNKNNNNNRFCWLTPLDTVRRSHTTNQFTVCGGCDGFFCPPNKTTNNCETFDPLDGTWGNDNVSLKSVGVFYNQSSWTMEDGAIYLIGGQETNHSAIVKDGRVKEGAYSYKETLY